jgi:hypothetical protein
MENEMTPKNRFDLEQDIFGAWNMVDGIDTLIEAIGDNRASTDDCLNILIGYKTLLNFKFEKLFATFEDTVTNGLYD